jgi:CBS domain containing-hemolysin-like protein
MTAVYIAAAVILTFLAAFTSLLQLLYLESLRIRTREYPSLEHFKEHLQEMIGLKVEDGATDFSVTKHISLALLGVVFFLVAYSRTTPLWQVALAASLLSVGAMIVATYLIPQMLYRRSTLAWLKAFVPIARFIALLTRPIAWLLGFVYSLVELGSPTNGKEEQPDAAEHIEALISAGQEEGLIQEDDRRLIQSVVAFGDKTVREVMTPRPNIVAIEVNRSLEDLRRLVINEQYSRIPVYEATIDQVIGFVHVRDMFELEDNERQTKTVRDLIRNIRIVPETKPVNDLLREMQEDGAHMAIVIDEYGNTAGLVTMEDMVEVIVGEIHDEHEPERDITAEPDGSYVVSGSFDVDRLHDLMKFRPAEDPESTTVGGLVTEWLGRVPRVGETLEREGLRIEVLAGNELRVEQVRLSRVPEVRQPVEATKQS